MADGHLGYAVPIGGVVAYKDAISPSGVGFDIACGNKAVRLDIPGQELRAKIGTIMDEVWATLSFGVGRKNSERVDHAIFDRTHAGWDMQATGPLRQKAESQLGTIGSGNHYVDLFTDEEDRVWIGVHFGSRGFGHGVATWFLKAAGAKDGMEVEPCVLSASSDLGEQYIRAIKLAGEYAYAGRDWVCDRVARMLGARLLSRACTITTTSHGARSTTVSSSGSCARARCPRFVVRKDSWVESWRNQPSFSRASRVRSRDLPCTAPSMARDG
jgi:tRNA-splicing ligase RtcB (3'-phosphate/5'-hydroxy nucleic acid ligase)